MTEDPDVEAGASLEGPFELDGTTTGGASPVDAAPEELWVSELARDESVGRSTDEGRRPVGPTAEITDDRSTRAEVVGRAIEDGSNPVGPTMDGIGALDDAGSELDGALAAEDDGDWRGVCGKRPLEGAAELCEELDSTVGSSTELDLGGKIDDGSNPVGII